VTLAFAPLTLYITPMFAEFIQRLTQPDPAQLPDGMPALRLTALLVGIAKRGNEYAPSERARIDQSIAKRYALDGDGHPPPCCRRRRLEAEAPLPSAYRAIRCLCPMTHRLAVIKALWEGRAADGCALDEKNALLRLVTQFCWGSGHRQRHRVTQTDEDKDLVYAQVAIPTGVKPLNYLGVTQEFKIGKSCEITLNLLRNAQ